MRKVIMLSLILSLVMMMSAACVPASAAEAELSDSSALSGYLLGYMSWGIKAAGLDVLQEKLEHSGRTLPEVRVAVIDSGLNTSNRYLSGRYVDGYNFLNNSTDYNDDNFHGTMVSGIIADGTSSNVKILPVKVNDKNGKGNLKNVAKGIYYAIEHGADVINLSLSAEDSMHTVTTLDDAIQAAVDAGIVVVVAAGNQSGDASDRYPANKSNVLTIASVDKNNAIGESSNTGSCIDFALPGVMIWAPYKTGLVSSFVDSGTSLAAPHAAAAAALIKTWDKRVDQDAVYEILRECAVDLGDAGFDNTYGWGMLDMSRFDINRTYEPPVRYLLGDSDGNEAVESLDMTWIGRRLNSVETPYEDAVLMHGDADGDGELTVMDITAIGYYLAELTTPYKIGELTK